MSNLYYICRLTDDGNWEGIRSCSGAEYADDLCDYFSELYPNAYTDVLDADEYNNSSKWPEMIIR